MKTKYNIDKLKSTGVLLFVNGNTWIAKAIKLVEGNECHHIAGVYFDNIDCQYKVAEMTFGGYWFWRKGGLISTELSKWIKSHKSNLVEIATPQLKHEQKLKLDALVMQDLEKGRAYDVGGLFGFLNKKLEKLNDPEKFFCSEYWMDRIEKVGRDIVPGPEELESPQDVMKMIGKTLVSILKKVVTIENSRPKYRRLLSSIFRKDM